MPHRDVRRGARVLGERALASGNGARAELRATLFAGKKARGSKIPLAISAKDSPAQREAHWTKLRAAFMRDGAAIIFHLKNHYALIFAMRDWVDAEGKLHRELLTARKGQRPTAWIPFDEACRTMTNWAGYKMMLIERVDLPPEDVQEEAQLQPQPAAAPAPEPEAAIAVAAAVAGSQLSS